MSKQFSFGLFVILKTSVRFYVLGIKTGKNQNIIIDKPVPELSDSFRSCLYHGILAPLFFHLRQNFLSKKTTHHGHFLVIQPFLLPVTKNSRGSKANLITGLSQNPGDHINTGGFSGCSGNSHYYHFF